MQYSPLRNFAWVPLAVATLLVMTPPSRGQQQQGGAGLDALEESKVMQELAQRGMDKLLDRDFDINKVSDEDRRSLRSYQALRLINTPGFIKLDPAERQRIVKGVADGIQAVLPTMHDPKLLMGNAATLIINGTSRAVNMLEYWGQNPAIQAPLRPIADAIVQMEDKAATEGAAQAEVALNIIPNPQAKAAIDAWQKLDDLANLAKYNEACAMYIQAISIDAADPKRKEVCDKALDILKQWDDPQFGIQEQVRLRMAMINTLKGAADPDALADAKTEFGEVIDDPQTPPGDKFEAKYFNIVCDLEANKLDTCQSALDDLHTWQRGNLPADKTTQDGAEAAWSMLQFRIYNAQAQAAGAATAARRRYDDQAIGVLLKLVEARPDLRGLIFEMVLQRLPAKPDMKQLDPLLLSAMVMKGIDEVSKPDDQKGDLVVLQRAVDADRELMARAPDTVLSQEDRDLAGIRMGLLLHRIATDGPVDKTIENHRLAVEAYIDYLTKFTTNAKRREFALDSVLGIVGAFRADPKTRDDPQVKQMYETALELAYRSGRRQFAYEYAKLLFDQGKMKEAAETFSHVADDPAKTTQKIMAEYYQMLATQEIQKTAGQGIQPELAQQIESVAGDLVKRIDAALPTASDDLRPRLRQVRVRTTVIAAESARAGKDSQGVLDILSGFETQIKDVPGTADLLGYVLFLRINAQMALGKVDDARAGLKEFIDSTPDPKQRLGIIGMILGKIDESYQQAVKRNDEKAIRELGDQCADLADMLVKEADKNPNDPAAREYRKYKARIMRLVAMRETDPEKKKERLLAALDAYRALLTDSPQDATILRFMALIQFDLGEYKEVRELLGQMFANKLFGPPLVEVVDPMGVGNETSTKANEVYWEAMYKLMRSDLELAKADPSQAAQRDDVIDQLKRLYIEWGKDLGGTTWAPQFMEVRQELIPTWTGDKQLDAPATEPATAPAPTPAH